LIVLGKSIVGAIYQGGKFQLYDTQQTATALSCYAVGLAGYAALKVLNPAFYALGDSRTPMLVSLISIGVNYGTGVTMIRVANFGHAGLAMATSAVALFSFVALFAILRGRIGGVYGRELGASVIRVAVAAGVMGVVVALTSHGMEAWLGVAQLARLADVVVSIPLGLAAFYAMCRTLGVSDLDMAIRAVAAPIRRRIKGTRKNS
jgi:putative peptidoglycan lipid II flippase